MISSSSATSTRSFSWGSVCGEPPPERARNASTDAVRMRRWPPAVFHASSVPFSTICWTVPGDRPSRLAATEVLQ